MQDIISLHAHIRFERGFYEMIGFQIDLLGRYVSSIQKTFLSNMTCKKVVTGTKVVTGNREADFVSVAPFEVNDEKTISDENVGNVITCDFPCKIFKNSTLITCGRQPTYALESRNGYKVMQSCGVYAYLKHRKLEALATVQKVPVIMLVVSWFLS